ncbi:MAG: TraR/DksA C4-type zinc finger protein [Kiritimatiellae bacterium]|nr:TraR/DksA C4-type zinc finger protein [Kiritimatiellia bacterium]
MKKKTSPKKTVAKKNVTKSAKSKVSTRKSIKKSPAKVKKLAKKKVAPKKPAGKKAVKKKPVKKAVKKAVKKKVAPKKPAKKAVLRSAPVAAKTNKLPAKDKRAFLAMLQGLKERHVGQISTLKKDSLSRHEPTNPEDDGTVTFDRQFALGLVSSEQDSLFEIEDAITRLGNKTYGVCEDCSKLIKRSRLEALPFVRMCVACQSQKERGKARFTPMFR